MPIVTMWKTADQRCVLIAAKGRFTVQITEGETVVRTEAPASADEAVTLAIAWGVDVGIPDMTIQGGKLSPARWME